MRKSEIFESFVKIAQERGLVSKAEHAEHTETSFPETNPRMDSLTIEQISKLYNTKPAQPKDMEYKRNIIEDAHPEPVVISPSYDKLNGLVENNNERQDIMLRIVMKDPDGHLVNRKYAKKNLLLSLVRVGNELDARNNDELRKLADACLEQMSQKKIEKTAWVVPVVIGVVALLGAVYAYEHITKQEGLREDYRKLTEKIVDLQRETTSYEMGYKFSDEFNKFLANLASKEKMVDDAVNAFQNAMSKSSLPKTIKELHGEDLVETASLPEGQEIVQTYNNLKNVVDNMTPYLTKVHQDLNDVGFKERAIVEKGAITQLIEKVPYLRDVQKKESFLGNFFNDLDMLVSNYENDVKKLSTSIEDAKQHEAGAQAALQSSPSSQTPAAPTGDTATPAAPAGEAKRSPFDALEEESKGLFGGLFGK